MNSIGVQQKFKRGNKVKILFGHPIWGGKEGISDMCPQEVGQEALIIGSYADQFGGNDREIYTIIFCETGDEESWKSEKQLEFIDEGGEHLIAEAKAKRELISKNNTDLTQIVKTWEEKKGRLSSETIVFLFGKVGFESAFHRNGEFYILFLDWIELHPLFDVIMTAKIEQDVTGRLNETCSTDLKNRIINFFNEVQSVKNVITASTTPKS